MEYIEEDKEQREQRKGYTRLLIDRAQSYNLQEEGVLRFYLWKSGELGL